MKKTEKEMDMRTNEMFRLADAAMKYRYWLVGKVEAVKVELGEAIANIEMREKPICRVGDCDLRGEELLLLVGKTFFGDLPNVLQSSHMRMFFGVPEEYLARAMKDIAVLRAYLTPLIGDKCPAMPESLTKIEIVEQVIIKE